MGAVNFATKLWWVAGVRDRRACCPLFALTAKVMWLAEALTKHR
jgi:hypothetical protein